MITKNYATLANGKQTHYRHMPKEGSNKALLMLHASPMSSEVMAPMMNALGGLCDLIAPDTPGYGQSDPLTEEQLNSSETLSPYVEWLNSFIDLFDYDQVAIYGAATGAQIAIEFAKTYPEKAKFIVLDSAAHFEKSVRDDALINYFPDLSPKADGSHLTKIWDISESLFTWFPWYEKNEEHRVSSSTPPVELVNATARLYLQAGPGYAEAYKRAFVNEDANKLLDVQIPATVIRWAGSLVKQHTDRFDDFEWPDHIQMRHCGKPIEERIQAIRETIQEQL